MISTLGSMELNIQGVVMGGLQDWTMISAICFIVTAPTVTLIFVVRSIITGRLVPRATHEEVIADRNEWRGVAMTQFKTVETQAQTITAQALTIREAGISPEDQP